MLSFEAKSSPRKAGCGIFAMLFFAVIGVMFVAVAVRDIGGGDGFLILPILLFVVVGVAIAAASIGGIGGGVSRLSDDSVVLRIDESGIQDNRINRHLKWNEITFIHPHVVRTGGGGSMAWLVISLTGGEELSLALTELDRTPHDIVAAINRFKV